MRGARKVFEAYFGTRENLGERIRAAREARSVGPFSRRNNQLPEGNRACGSDIQGIYLVVHGDLHRVIAAGDGALGQAVAFRAQYERNFLAFLQLLVAQAHRVVGKRERCRGEAELVEQGDAGLCPIVGVFPDARPGNLKHGAHRNAHRTAIERVVACRRDQHGVDPKCCCRAEDRPDVGVVRDVF